MKRYSINQMEGFGLCRVWGIEISRNWEFTFEMFLCAFSILYAAVRLWPRCQRDWELQALMSKQVLVRSIIFMTVERVLAFCLVGNKAIFWELFAAWKGSRHEESRNRDNSCCQVLQTLWGNNICHKVSATSGGWPRPEARCLCDSLPQVDPLKCMVAVHLCDILFVQISHISDSPQNEYLWILQQCS